MQPYSAACPECFFAMGGYPVAELIVGPVGCTQTFSSLWPLVRCLIRFRFGIQQWL